MAHDKLTFTLDTGDGSVFVRCNLAATSSSIELFAGMSSHAKPPRSPITVSVVAV